MDFFWEKRLWEREDKHLRAISESPFVRPFPTEAWKKGLYIIRGPRQVGKSSWLKTILHTFPHPAQAFYLSCENIDQFKELSTILKSISKQRSFILLDEISFVSEWSRSIKSLMDSGYNGTLILTGSHSFDLKAGADQLPGRFGGGREILLMPMAFTEFVKARKDARWPRLSRLQELQLYFRIGGFPLAVQESGKDGRKPENAMEIYRRWLVGDILKLKKQETYLREILSQIALTMTTPLSLQKLAQRTQIGSHHTALDYVSILESSFALRTCYAIDPNTGAFRSRKEKKFYFTDPLIYWMALEWAGFPNPQESDSLIAEMVAHESLSRHPKISKQRFGYFHSQLGEVDFYSRNAWALEIKWSEYSRNLSKAFKDLDVPQKLVWTQENYLSEWPN